MTAASSPDAVVRSWRAKGLPIALLVAVLLSAKLYTIHHYGNPTPYWDQWDAEAARLYKPWLEGELSIAHLFEPHNEHRVLTTRLVHLVLFEALGRRWDPVAQMYVNAVLHASAIALLVLFARSVVPLRLRWSLWIAAAALFVVPFGWDSTLQGFNTHFYITLLGGVVLLWSCVDSDFNPGKSALCILVAALLVLTMASGSLAVLAAGGVLCFRRFFLSDRRVPLVTIALLAVAAAAGVVLTPHIPGHEHLKAQSLGQFVAAVARIWAWPGAADRVAPASFVLPALMQAPLLLGIFVTLGKTEARRPLLFLVALGCWFALSTLALGYGRAVDVLTSRYLDTLCFGLFANYAALLILWGQCARLWRPALLIFSALWLAVLAWSVVRNLPVLQQELANKALTTATQEHRVRGYLLTGHAGWLQDAGHLEIPYPSAARLQHLLDDPTIRGILPRNLTEAPPAKPGHSEEVAPLLEPAALLWPGAGSGPWLGLLMVCRQYQPPMFAP